MCKYNFNNIVVVIDLLMYFANNGVLYSVSTSR